MRVADKMAFEQVKYNIGKNRTDMADLQNKAATQKRVTKPSDDPVAATRVLASRIEVQGADQYIKNLNYARSFLDFTDQSLDELTGHLVRAKELALGQASDGSANDQSRRVVAEEIGQIYRQMVQIGNRKLGDRYIFGGFKTTKTPFNFYGKYTGDEGQMMIHVDKGNFVPMNIPGSAVFTGEGLSRDSSSFKVIDQAQTAEELKQQLSAKAEEDKAKNAAPQAQPEVSLRGPASVPANELEQVGTSTNSSEYGTNIFEAVKRLEVALRTNDKGGIQDAIEPLDGAVSQVVLTRSRVGARSMVLDNSLETLQKTRVDSKGLVSQLEDVDAFEIISDMNKTENTLQATLSTSGRLIQKSLMDFVR